jgi:hypothetical protein
MNTNPFDDGFFAQRAEGNLPFAPDSFLKSPVIKRAGDSWVTANVNRASIIQKPMRNMSCQPVTLNSFAAFADDSGPSGFDPSNPADVAAMYGDNFVGPIQSSDPTVTQPAGVTSPGAVKGNSILDSISGLIKGITPIAGQAVTAAAGGQSTKQQQQLLKQYLAGKLPNMMLNAQGQVVPKTTASSGGLGSMGPILLLAGLGAVVVMTMGHGGSKKRR